MKIIFSDHANIKIDQRDLPRDFIVETVRMPDFTRPSRGLREERYKYFGKNWLKVVVAKEPKSLVVVTAHWVVKIK